jgi:hypothetical protein
MDDVCSRAGGSYRRVMRFRRAQPTSSGPGPANRQLEAFVLAQAAQWGIKLAPGRETEIVSSVVALVAGARSGELRLSVALIDQFRERTERLEQGPR